MLLSIKRLLKNELKDKLTTTEIELLPSSFQKIGDIVILNLKPELLRHSRIIGNIVLRKIPNTRTVCSRTGFITGRFRQPQLKVVAGENNTETIHKEHGIFYKLDVSKLMFAKGNLNERKRISKLVKPNEVVVDMFAGIGYFSLPIAKLPYVKKVYSIEINPDSFQYLLENIKLNNVQDKIVPIKGDCEKEVLKLKKIADRVIMGLLPSPKKYLSAAMKVVKPSGTIHYHGLEKKPEKLENDIGDHLKVIKKVKIKSYSPKVFHFVLDCEFSH